MSTTPETYHRPSGRFSAFGVALALVSGLAAAALFGTAYAYACIWMKELGRLSIVLMVILPAAFGAGCGWITAQALKAGKNRNPQIALAASIVVAAGALYATWVVTLFATLHQAGMMIPLKPLLRDPTLVWRTMRMINETGTWMIFDHTPHGAVLWAIWGVEAAIIAGCAYALCWSTWSAVPFCEECGTWCLERLGVGYFAEGERMDLVARLEAHDFRVLENLGPARGSRFLRLDLHGCPKCRQTHTLSLSQLVVTPKNGKNETKATEWVHRLNLTPAQAEEVPLVAARVAERAMAPAT